MRTSRILALALAPAVMSMALAAPASAAPQTPVPAAAKKAAGNQIEVVQHGTGWTVSWTAPGKHRVFASQRPKNPSKSGKLVGSSKWGSIHVKGLRDTKRWYFEVAPAREVRKAKKKGKDVKGIVAASRDVGLDSTSNTRDLGGFRTVDGRSLRWGVLFRTDAVAEPTARDAKVLKGMKLRRSVDFRAADEIAKDGANVYAPSVKEHQLPLLDESTAALSEAIQAVLAGGDPAAAEELLGDGKAEEIAANAPVAMMRSTEAQRAFGKSLKILAKKNGSPMIFNCTAGKDRTGIFSAIALRVLGVPEKPLLEDYELSNEYRAAHNQRTYAFLESAGVDPDLLRPLLEQDGANLAGVFRAIEEDYGSFDRFVRKGLGLNAKTVKKLKANLLV